MAELALCPFCGTQPMECPNPEDRSYPFNVQCLQCGTEGPVAFSVPEGIDKWNRRTGIRSVLLRAKATAEACIKSGGISSKWEKELTAHVADIDTLLRGLEVADG